MMDWIGDVLSSRATLDGYVVFSCGLVIFCFIKGWLLTPFQVKNTIEALQARVADANQRADDWKNAYETRSESLDIALQQVDRLKTVGDTANKVLSSLPIPTDNEAREGGGS